MVVVLMDVLSETFGVNISALVCCRHHSLAAELWLNQHVTRTRGIQTIPKGFCCLWACFTRFNNMFFIAILLTGWLVQSEIHADPNCLEKRCKFQQEEF